MKSEKAVMIIDLAFRRVRTKKFVLPIITLEPD